MLEGVESDASKNLANVIMMTKLRDGMKDALAPNKRDLDGGMEGVRSVLGVRRDSGARTARATAGESEGIIGSSRSSESEFHL